MWYYQIIETDSCNCFFIPYGASILTRNNSWWSFSQLICVGFLKLCSMQHLLQFCEMLISIYELPCSKKQRNISLLQELSKPWIMYTRNFQEGDVVDSRSWAFLFLNYGPLFFMEYLLLSQGIAKNARLLIGEINVIFMELLDFWSLRIFFIWKKYSCILVFLINIHF